MASNEADEELELQILGDIQDVFGSWRDDSDDDDDEAGELASDGQPTPKQRLAPSEGSQTDLTIPLLRSQTRLSKRTLAQAIASLPTDPPAKRTRGPPSAVFAPFSITDYHDRVGTFNLLNFTAAAFTSSEAALAGWSAGGRDRLKCGCCQAAWKVSDFTGLQAPARKKLAARMRAHLKESHRPSCPWRVGIDLIDKAGPSALAKAMPLRSAEIHRQADEMRPHLPAGLQLAHPLTESDNAAMAAALRPRPRTTTRSPAASDGLASPLPAAEILAVFHWQLLPPPTSDVHKGSRVPSSLSSLKPAVVSAPAPSQTVVTCSLCSRRLGLWSFTASRALDVVASHATSCPVLLISVPDRLQALAASEPTPQPSRRQVRDLVDALLGPKVTLNEVRGWKVEVDRLEGSALSGHTPTKAVRPRDAQ